MSPVPLSKTVVAILTRVVKVDGSPVPLATCVAQGELEMCSDGEHCLDFLECVAKDVDDALLGINKFLIKKNWPLVDYYYHKFCHYVKQFLCVVNAIGVQVARMLYVNWNALTSLCSLCDHVKSGMEGTLRFVDDAEDKVWKQAGVLMHLILSHVHERLRCLEHVIKAEAPPSDDDLRHLQEEFVHRVACCKQGLHRLFLTRWDTNRLRLSDQNNVLSIRGLIQAGKPKDNILVDIDPEGDMPPDMMTLHIFNNRCRITDETVNDYFTYRAKWELLHEHMASLKIKRRKLSSIRTQRGRPRATDKSLADYVTRGIDAESLRQEIIASLDATMGMADDVVHVMQRFLAEGKMRDVIPFGLMKKEFGEQVNCTSQSYNRLVNALKLRKAVT